MSALQGEHLIKNQHLKAVLQALLVTFLWSTSWVLIKIGLVDIPALTFAGLRLSLAFLCLLPLAIRPGVRDGIRRLDRTTWGRLIVLGIIYYGVTLGAQFLGLFYLPALTVNLMLNFTSLLVALLGLAFLNERPTRLQWSGMAVFLSGVLIYFYPQMQAGSLTPSSLSNSTGAWLGLGIMVVGVIANAISTVMGRAINRSRLISPLIVTLVSMGTGALVLLAGGIAIQGLPRLSLIHWAIITWLAVVNTAFTFTLWNHTQRVLSAMESSMINSTMMIQIALLAWIFLDEKLTPLIILGMLLAAAGAVIVQWRMSDSTVGKTVQTQESIDAG